MSRVAHAILHSALARTESRGAHFRNDYPHRDDANFQKHSISESGWNRRQSRHEPGCFRGVVEVR